MKLGSPEYLAAKAEFERNPVLCPTCNKPLDFASYLYKGHTTHGGPCRHELIAKRNFGKIAKREHRSTINERIAYACNPKRCEWCLNPLTFEQAKAGRKTDTDACQHELATLRRAERWAKKDAAKDDQSTLSN